MTDIINAFFNWVYQILQLWLNTVVIDGYKFLHLYLFIGIVGILVSFIIRQTGRKNDKSE